jgi:hypothetical protein
VNGVVNERAMSDDGSNVTWNVSSRMTLATVTRAQTHESVSATSRPDDRELRGALELHDRQVLATLDVADMKREPHAGSAADCCTRGGARVVRQRLRTARVSAKSAS